MKDIQINKYRNQSQNHLICFTKTVLCDQTFKYKMFPQSKNLPFISLETLKFILKTFFLNQNEYDKQ